MISRDCQRQYEMGCRCAKLAERVGFEPTVEETPTHALQACLLDHSSTSPRRGWDSNPRSELIGDRFSRAAP